MHLNAILLVLTFFTESGCRQLTSLHSNTPSLRTSKKLSISPDVLIGSPVISLIHSNDSCASSSLYFELIYKGKINEISINHIQFVGNKEVEWFSFLHKCVLFKNTIWRKLITTFSPQPSHIIKMFF